jgi:nucleotide-binding universal stress UspA family protein
LEKKMKKILCATDETEVSRNAERFAADLALAVNAELCFVYVSPPKTDYLKSRGGWMHTILDETEARGHEILKHSVEVAIARGVKNAICMSVNSDSVVSTIIGIAEKEDFDHIIVGSTGREGIPRFIIGSVAGGLIHKAHCPVTVVR